MCTGGQQVLSSTLSNTSKCGTSCSSPCQRENGGPSLYMKYHRCSKWKAICCYDIINWGMVWSLTSHFKGDNISVVNVLLLQMCITVGMAVPKTTETRCTDRAYEHCTNNPIPTFFFVSNIFLCVLSSVFLTLCDRTRFINWPLHYVWNFLQCQLHSHTRHVLTHSYLLFAWKSSWHCVTELGSWTDPSYS